MIGLRKEGALLDIRESYLNQYFDEISPKDFYRSIFPKGELQEKGVMNDFKFNAIAVELLPESNERNVKRYTITDDLDIIDELLQHDNFILMSPISYIGKTRESKNARYIYALAIDLDGVTKKMNMVDLFHQIEIADFLPRPTFTVSSGNGLHLYYVFEQPVPCYKNVVQQLERMKHNLTKKIWNKYITELSQNVQYQSLFQGFRLVGGTTKNGGRTRAYITGEKVTVEYLNDYVLPENQLKGFKYKSKLTLEEAKKKYPDWYEKRIVNQEPKGHWICNRGLYEWWLKRLTDDDNPEIIEGHRYYGVMCLSIYAKKCGVPREELENDAFGLVESLDKLTKDPENHFTRADVLAALQMYDDNYITFPRDTIAQLTGLEIKPNKRRKKPLKRDDGTAFKVARMIQNLQDPTGEWRNKEGRPSAELKVRQWQQQNPDGRKADCIRETGLTKPTVYKWWNEDLNNKFKR